MSVSLALRLSLSLAIATLTAGSAPGAATAAEQVVIVERLSIDATGSELPRVRSTLRVEVPATDSDAEDLLTSRQDGAEYVLALRTLLSGIGVFPLGSWRPADPVAPGLPPPRPLVRKGRATFVMRTGRSVAGDEIGARFGHWYVTTDGDRITLALVPQPPHLDTALVVKVWLKGALLAHSSEPPLRAGRKAPLTWRFNSGQGLKYLVVVAEAQGAAGTYLTLPGSPGACWAR